jgi:quercetin dioxygenase-like cupin family protein
VEYGEGSVANRVLAKNSAGNLTLFAFDEGPELGEHTAPFDAVVQILDGEAELIIGAKKVLPTVGQTVPMPAIVHHSIHAPARFKMLFIMIREK